MSFNEITSENSFKSILVLSKKNWSRIGAMKNNIKYLFLAACISLTLPARPTIAQDKLFRSVQLEHGIYLDVPSHWTVLSLESRNNISAAGQAMVDNAGIEDQSGRKKNLLAVNATPYPAGAMIRVSVTAAPGYTQSDLAVATPEDLKEVGFELFKMFRKIESSGGPKIIEIDPVHIERIGNYRALVMPYRRAGLNGSSPWQVTQYKIPVSSRLIEITLSYRQSDAIIWRPILERVKRSIKI